MGQNARTRIAREVALRNHFAGQLAAWEERYGMAAGDRLRKQLLKFSEKIPTYGFAFGRIETGILECAQRRGITPEAFVTELFSKPSARAIINFLKEQKQCQQHD